MTNCVSRNNLFNCLPHFYAYECYSEHCIILDINDVQGSRLHSPLQQTLFLKRIYPAQVRWQPTSKVNANPLLSERGKFEHTRTAKHALAAYTKYISFQDLESVSLLLYRHSPTYAVETFRNDRNFTQVGTEHNSRSLCVYVEGNPVEIRTTRRWNLTGHSMTTPPSVLSPSSILPGPSSLCASFSQEKIPHAVLKYYFSFYFLNTAESKFS